MKNIAISSFLLTYPSLFPLHWNLNRESSEDYEYVISKFSDSVVFSVVEQ